MPPRSLRALFVEDSEDDALLVVRALTRGGFEVAWERVETAAEMIAAQAHGPWDLVISDFHLPRFSAGEALALHRADSGDTPFILVSGAVGEEQAVELLKAGADDFLLKNHLARLCPAVERELREAASRRARRRAEAELRASEARFRGAFVGSPIGMALVAEDGAYLAVNPALCHILGYSEAELLARTFQTTTHPDDLAGDQEVRRRLLAGEIPHANREKRYLHRLGHVVHALVSVSLLREPAAQQTYFIAQVQDLTERRRTEEVLRQTQKVEAIGRLAGGVAHDFNNLLGVILGHGEQAQKQLPAGHPVGERVDRMLDAARRAAGLTRQLLAFSRKQDLKPEVLDLNAAIADLHDMLVRLIGEDVAVVVDAAPDLGCVRADPSQLQQVIVNLAVNARDAMPYGGRLTLTTENADVDADLAALYPSMDPGRYVKLSVTDTGTGMDPETQHRLFEPFFTTKAEGKGTGLGLATVYGIVKQSGGFIWVESAPGRGSTFEIYLRRVESPVAGEAVAAPPAEMAHGHETILLVEDNEALYEVILETLQDQGYAVLAAADGEQALAVAGAHPGPIDLLLTDVVMPRVGGAELARRIGAERPGLRVVFMSGYTDGAIAERGVLANGTELLAKPFTGEQLAHAVRQALDRQSNG